MPHLSPTTSNTARMVHVLRTHRQQAILGCFVNLCVKVFLVVEQRFPMVHAAPPLVDEQ